MLDDGGYPLEYPATCLGVALEPVDAYEGNILTVSEALSSPFDPLSAEVPAAPKRGLRPSKASVDAN